MARFSWLHLTDLHLGLQDQDHLWPNVRDAFYADLANLHAICGPWDVVFFTGDFVQKGAETEFTRLDRLLTDLWRHLEELGSHPVLIGVPGNHDLSRPDPDAPEVAILTEPAFRSKKGALEKLYAGSSSPYRRVVD